MDHESSYSVETLLDATIVLYDECCTSSFKKEKTVSEFVAGGKFFTPVSQPKQGATSSVPHWIMVWIILLHMCMILKTSIKSKRAVVSALDRLALSNHHWSYPVGEGGVIFPLQTLINQINPLLYLSSTLCACIYVEETCNQPLHHISLVTKGVLYITMDNIAYIIHDKTNHFFLRRL